METLNTSSALIRAKLLTYSGPLAASYEQLWNNDRLDELMPSFLVLIHQIMRASVPLMECAVRRCNEVNSNDPLCPALADYYGHHIEEERDHDVWALEDLEAAGFDPKVALDAVPSPAVAQLAGRQYYWILHHHPIMLLGYIMVLEAYPPSNTTIDKIRDLSGVSDAGFRNLRKHGELDVHHREELDQFLDSLPLEKNHIEMIGMSMLHSIESLVACLQTLRPIDWHRPADRVMSSSIS